MNKQELLTQLKIEVDSINHDLKALAHRLTTAELTERPSPERWSPMEVAEHMLIVSRVYLKNARKSRDNYKGPIDTAYQPGVLGNYAANSMLPKENGTLPFKMKTFRCMDPARNNEPIGEKNSFSKLIDLNNEWLQFYSRPKELDMNRMKVVSSLGRLITFKMGDALRFNSNHNLRHMNQLKQAIESCKGLRLEEILAA